MAKENKQKKVRSKIGQFGFCKQWKLGWTQVTKVQKSFALGKSMIWQFVVRKQWKKRKLNIRWSVGVCQVCQHLVTLNYKNHKSWNSGYSFFFAVGSQPTYQYKLGSLSSILHCHKVNSVLNYRNRILWYQKIISWLYKHFPEEYLWYPV